ncbi:DUF3726 domain-containing protein [Leisingera sp. MMG026]|uniref:DUF3726 domain-containing protein n=1 Tax=Leisingera sp. MMG026 TaxID=2909982 RepID=UPI001F3145B0|nr:DUF3726 domain-containing protein [Leisingera sp. MMG026]MCF6433372.1 DUF3726 domain-containing protein [Leisingera sp. MMG026]
MRVSRNEMIAALSRAYEGAGHQTGDYEDAAQLITWSHMCGLGGIERITLPPEAPKGGVAPRLDYENAGLAVIDAGGAEVCEHGSLASDLAFAKAQETGFAIVELANCRDPGLILRSLSLVAQKGVYIGAYWSDQIGMHGASFESGAVFPNYWRVEQAGVGKEASALFIVCTTQAALLADAVTRQAEHPELQRFEVTAAQLAANYDQSLERGISVSSDHWSALNAAAWPILVPSDDKSRAGAGPA